MPRKVLLSFVGNNPYKECCYTHKEFNSGVVRFIQEALFRLHNSAWTIEDKAYIFLTPEAAINNWEGQFYNGQGLKKALAAYSNFEVEAIKDIPSGQSEPEVWALFERLYQCLESGDEVYLDITNGFRSLPMLLMVLLDYAKALKNIKVQKIYYGAFETIAPYPKIEENFPNPIDRLAPILELTSFSVLQDWTAAALDFSRNGNINRLQLLTQEHQLDALLTDEKGKATALNLLELINNNLQALIPLIQTNRGKDLGQFSFNQLLHLLQMFATKVPIINPLTTVVQEIKNKVAHFEDAEDLFWLKAAKWCSQHHLIQQGITQLQEGLITWFCLRFKKQLNDDFFDYTQYRPRLLINKTFGICEHGTGRNSWPHINKSHPRLTRILVGDPMMQKMTVLFRQLTELRNDINHGGYQEDAEPAFFIEQLATYIEEMELVIRTEEIG